MPTPPLLLPERWRHYRPPPPTDATSNRIRALGNDRLKVLAVDDEADALAFLEALFVDEGFEFIRASTGAQALAMIRTLRADVVIVDYRMPAMNGLEFCELLRSDHELREIPIIIYTAYNVPPHSNCGLYDLVFVKPVDPQALLRGVCSLLPTRSS